MLKVDNISFSYDHVKILNKINVEVPDGKVVCLMGRNGVGKTTLLRNIVGLENPSSGKIYYNNCDITHLPAMYRARSGLALVPQGRMIFPRITVKENLQIGLSARKDNLKIIPNEIYELFPILRDMAHRKGGNLSGGQQQQLAIGRALVGDPKVLLLDEPTEGIQPNIIQSIGHVLKSLITEKKMTVVLVEQYVDFIKEFGDLFFIINKGQVVSSGKTRNLNDNLVQEHLSV